MRIRAIINAALAVVATLFGLAAAPAFAGGWIKAESEHFAIYSTISEKKTREYVQKLESFRSLTNMLLGARDEVPQVKFTLYLLADRDQLQVVRPNFSKDVAGVFFSCGEGSSAYVSVPTGAFEQDPGLITLFHEYSHYVMAQHARTYYPAWYVEGFAEYLSTADYHGGEISIGEPSIGRKYALAEDRWISFEKVLNPDFGFAGDKSNDAWEIESFYAQSWLLTHYMLDDPERAKALNAYFAALSQGGEPVALWESTTGIKVSGLRALLKRYSERMFFLKVPVAAYPESRVTITQVGKEAGLTLLDRSLLTTCMSQDQGKDVLNRLTVRTSAGASDPDVVAAITRGQLLYGDLASAETTAGKQLDAHPDMYEPNYLMGRVYFKMAETASGQDRDDLTDAARGFFLAAYKIDKLNATNLYYLGLSFGNTRNFPDSNALNAAVGAHALAPSVGEYAAFAAFTQLSNGKRDEAIATLTPFTGDPHNRDYAEHIRKAIDAIKAGDKTDSVMKILNAS